MRDEIVFLTGYKYLIYDSVSRGTGKYAFLA